jgi:hypothetical protein
MQVFNLRIPRTLADRLKTVAVDYKDPPATVARLALQRGLEQLEADSELVDDAMRCEGVLRDEAREVFRP